MSVDHLGHWITTDTGMVTCMKEHRVGEESCMFGKSVLHVAATGALMMIVTGGETLPLGFAKVT